MQGAQVMNIAAVLPGSNLPTAFLVVLIVVMAAAAFVLFVILAEVERERRLGKRSRRGEGP